MSTLTQANSANWFSLINLAIFQKILSGFNSKFIDLKKRLNPKVWSERSIVVYAGHTSYEWTPDSLKTGIGGSEGDVIYLGIEWAKLGYKVTVYNNCGKKEGVYDGVEYIHYSRFNKYDTFDTLIIWRYPWRLSPQTKAKRIWLDLHEVLQPEQVAKDKLKRFHKVFVCSQYHRSLVPEIPEEKIVIITNGFDQAYCQWSDKPKDPYKLIYASNYVRGLEPMLTYGWPIIKKEVPEAHLSIYYGWGSFDEKKPGRREWKEKMIELMSQPGVNECGRIGREELVKEKATTAIHYYGCTFQEIDCNSVRESAVVGCVPVTSDYTVFLEKNYCVKVSGNPHEQETQEKIAYKIVELLKNPEQLEEIRQQFQERVNEETWENIAKAWLAQL